MPWLTPAVALLCGLATALTAPAVLRSLPSPEGSDGPSPYRGLSTPAFLVQVGLTSALASGLVTAALPRAQWVAWASLALVAVVAASIDARTLWLPLPLAHAGWVIAALGAVTVAITDHSWWPMASAVAGAAALGGLFHLLWRVTGAFGYGDVRLAATIGAVASLDSPTLALSALLWGTVAGAMVGVIHRLRGRTGPFPYGPGLLAGPFLALALRLIGV